MLRAVIACFLSLALAACGGGGSAGASTPTSTPAIPTSDINLLFMGNSHTDVNNIPATVAAMVGAARPGKTVSGVSAPGWMFLEDRAQDPASVQLLRSGTWKFVVLQAQEYSTSGLFAYPTDGAVSLVHMTRSVNAVPIMFPEWPRRGIDETQRIFDLHVSIAQQASACVPPIPQSWDLAVARYPELAPLLWADDGNHSAPAGAFLAALIIATTMTGQPPTAVPFLPQVGVDAGVQAKLRGVATDTVTAYPPHQWCPQDAYLP